MEIVKIPILRVALIMVMCSLVLFSALKLNKKFRTIYLAVDRSLVSLKDIHLEDIHEPIYTEGYIDANVPYWINDWSKYFIHKNSLTHWPTKFNPNSLLNKVPDNSLVLSGKYSRWYYPPKIVLKKIIWENEYYQIGRVCNTDRCIANLGLDDYFSTLIIGNNDWENALLLNGWGKREGYERWMNTHTATLRLFKKIPPKLITLEARTLQKTQKMSLSINRVEIGTVDLSTEWTGYTFPLNIELDGDGVYRIQFSLINLHAPTNLKISNDIRSKSAGFKKIKLE